jgi:osmoprotectant transport system ATP-binding protein
MFELEHVGKVFPGTAAPAVGDLSLEVQEGEIAVLIGPSGCGKSTTLRMINRLIEPTSGRITVAGRDVAQQKAHELRLSIG